MTGYFVVYLADGRVLDFDGNCGSVDYSTGNWAVFKQAVSSIEYLTLAIIPSRSIISIERRGVAPR